jgi:hypothetical protein
MQDTRIVDRYLHHSVRLHGLARNELSTGATLLLSSTGEKCREERFKVLLDRLFMITGLKVHVDRLELRSNNISVCCLFLVSD